MLLPMPPLPPPLCLPPPLLPWRPKAGVVSLAEAAAAMATCAVASAQTNRAFATSDPVAWAPLRAAGFWNPWVQAWVGPPTGAVPAQLGTIDAWGACHMFLIAVDFGTAVGSHADWTGRAASLAPCATARASPGAWAAAVEAPARQVAAEGRRRLPRWRRGRADWGSQPGVAFHEGARRGPPRGAPVEGGAQAEADRWAVAMAAQRSR